MTKTIYIFHFFIYFFLLKSLERYNYIIRGHSIFSKFLVQPNLEKAKNYKYDRF